MGKQCQTLFWGAPKSLEIVIAAMKLKMLAPWKESYDKHRQHSKRQRQHFASKGLYSQSYGLSSSHVRAGPKRRLSTEELMLLNCAGEDSSESLGLQDQTSQF